LREVRNDENVRPIAAPIRGLNGRPP